MAALEHYATQAAGWDYDDWPQRRAHRALSVVDLLSCATAAQHELIVLHDDKDFVTAARCLPDVRERSIHHRPVTS